MAEVEAGQKAADADDRTRQTALTVISLLQAGAGGAQAVDAADKGYGRCRTSGDMVGRILGDQPPSRFQEGRASDDPSDDGGVSNGW